MRQATLCAVTRSCWTPGRATRRTDSVRRSAGASALLFVAGLFLFAAGASVLLGGGDLCASATGSSVADALGAPCGGVSALGGALLLLVAVTVLWVSQRMERNRR